MHSDELELSREQIEEFRKKHSEAKKKMIQIGSQMKMDMIDLMDAVMREEIDMQTAEAKASEMGKLKGEMFTVMIHAMQEMRHVLTPDQHKKVREMIMSWFKKGCATGSAMEECQEPSEMQEE